MPRRDIIVVGASAGGVEALTKVVQGLPTSLPAAVFVILHVSASGTSVLPQVLARAGPLPVEHARHGATIAPGKVYVAPPARHLTFRGGRMELHDGPRENGHRPCIDVTFRSAAREYGARVIGVVLSGSGDDGTAGLQLVRALGGIAIVQAPEDATFPDMPRSAGSNVAVHASVPAADIPSLLVQFSRAPIPAPGAELATAAAAGDERQEATIETDKFEQGQGERANMPAVLSCPDCGGALWEMQEGRVQRYRCHVGHSYSPVSLEVQKALALENALWTAVRMFRERAMLARRSATQARDGGMSFLVANAEHRAEDAERCASLIQSVLTQEHVSDVDSAETTAPG